MTPTWLMFLTSFRMMQFLFVLMEPSFVYTFIKYEHLIHDGFIKTTNAWITE